MRSQPSDVYWNSHRRCFSIKPKQPDGPVQHSTGPLLLENPIFKVSARGRQWVIANRKKTVHATIRATPRVPDSFSLPSTARRVKYNSHKTATFVTEDGTPVYEANRVYLINNEVWIT